MVKTYRDTEMYLCHSRFLEDSQEVPLSRDAKGKSHMISSFKAMVCHEDHEHIRAVKDTNLETTPTQMLIAIFYKTVTKPVQGHLFH